MVTVKTHPAHPASMAQRIADKLKNSGGEEADVIAKHGTVPTRAITNIHHSAVRDHGKADGPKGGTTYGSKGDE